jgi:type IV pilus assembly protein PilV
MKKLSEGFTLLESLIAIAIFAIGFMGLAALQVKSIQLSESTNHRHLALNLATEMAEQLNSNLSAINSSAFFGAAVENTDCLGSGCTPDQMAQHAIYEWQAAVANQLPGGAAIICRDSTPTDGLPGTPSCSDLADSTAPIAIKIWWKGPSDGSQQSVSLSLSP